MNRADRMDILRFALIATLLILSSAALAQEVDCNFIRSKVAEHGTWKAYAWALAHGYSPKEIARIRRKCGV